MIEMSTMTKRSQAPAATAIATRAHNRRERSNNSTVVALLIPPVVAHYAVLLLLLLSTSSSVSSSVGVTTATDIIDINTDVNVNVNVGIDTTNNYLRPIIIDTDTGSIENNIDISDSNIDFDYNSNSNIQRIVGGDQVANPEEFPYFVWLGNCAGALIASDIVLFAAHCGTGLKDTALIVGAYQRNASPTQLRTRSGNAKERFCQKWIAHPNYNSSNQENDFALCQLNTPVILDQNQTKLILNSNQDVPTTGNGLPDGGDELIVIGFGLEKEQEDGGTLQNMLQKVTVPYVSNELCGSSSYYSGRITSTQLCAGYTNGQKDACQGDSGGPIVQKIVNRDGLIQHIHVGIVSWGLGCARRYKPGVYARTSSGFSWIQEQVCNVWNSVDTEFCSTNSNSNDHSPEPNTNACPSNQKLTISLLTDQYPPETSWELIQTSNNNQVVLSEDRYKYKFFAHDYDSICLEEGETYTFKIYDNYGDGLCTAIAGCGSYTIFLGDQIQKSSNGNFQYIDVVDNIRVEAATPNVATISSTSVPTQLPSSLPSSNPSLLPSMFPSNNPSEAPSSATSESPTIVIAIATGGGGGRDSNSNDMNFPVTGGGGDNDSKSNDVNLPVTGGEGSDSTSNDISSPVTGGGGGSDGNSNDNKFITTPTPIVECVDSNDLEYYTHKGTEKSCNWVNRGNKKKKIRRKCKKRDLEGKQLLTWCRKSCYDAGIESACPTL